MQPQAPDLWGSFSASHQTPRSYVPVHKAHVKEERGLATKELWHGVMGSSSSPLLSDVTLDKSSALSLSFLICGVDLLSLLLPTSQGVVKIKGNNMGEDVNGKACTRLALDYAYDGLTVLPARQGAFPQHLKQQHVRGCMPSFYLLGVL